MKGPLLFNMLLPMLLSLSNSPKSNKVRLKGKSILDTCLDMAKLDLKDDFEYAALVSEEWVLVKSWELYPRRPKGCFKIKLSLRLITENDRKLWVTECGNESEITTKVNAENIIYKAQTINGSDVKKEDSGYVAKVDEGFVRFEGCGPNVSGVFNFIISKNYKFTVIRDDNRKIYPVAVATAANVTLPNCIVHGRTTFVHNFIDTSMKWKANYVCPLKSPDIEYYNDCIQISKLKSKPDASLNEVIGLWTRIESWEYYPYENEVKKKCKRFRQEIVKPIRENIKMLWQEKCGNFTHFSPKLNPDDLLELFTNKHIPKDNKEVYNLMFVAKSNTGYTYFESCGEDVKEDMNFLVNDEYKFLTIFDLWHNKDNVHTPTIMVSDKDTQSIHCIVEDSKDEIIDWTPYYIC